MKDIIRYIPNKQYYYVSCYSKALRAPVVVTIIYIGVNICDKSVEYNDDVYCFQDVKSFYEIGNYTTVTTNNGITIYDINERDVSRVRDLHGLIEDIILIESGFYIYSSPALIEKMLKRKYVK